MVGVISFLPSAGLNRCVTFTRARPCSTQQPPEQLLQKVIAVSFKASPHPGSLSSPLRRQNNGAHGQETYKALLFAFNALLKQPPPSCPLGLPRFHNPRHASMARSRPSPTHAPTPKPPSGERGLYGDSLPVTDGRPPPRASQPPPSRGAASLTTPPPTPTPSAATLPAQPAA